MKVSARVLSTIVDNKMSNEKSRSEGENMIGASDNTVNAVPAKCLEDPRFIKVLATSLLSEIAALELILVETDGEIKGLKENVAKGLEKRKVLKEFIQVFTKKNAVLNQAYESLERDAKHRSIEVATIQNRLDNASLREIADRDRLKKLLNDYEEKWQGYKVTYEERPLAKERREAYVTSKQLQAQLMIAEYEKENVIKMLKQRKLIDNMRVKVSIVKISEMVLERWNDQKQIQNLNVEAKQLQYKLNALTRQLTQLEQEEEKKKRSKIQTPIMPPPRLDFSFMRSMYNKQGHSLNKKYPTSSQPRDLDSMSISTLMLEEMCNTNDEITEIREENVQPPEEGEEESDNNPISVSMISKQNEKTSASKLIANETDIQNKLNKLRIEKKITFVLDEEHQRRRVKCNVDNDKNNDDTENVENSYKRSAVESHQRTLRWCEESQDEFASVSLFGQRSNSFNEQTRGNLSLEEEGNKSVDKKMPKASSIHGSETKSLRLSEKDKTFENGSPMEVTDETTKAMTLKRNSGYNVELVDKMEKQGHRIRPAEKTLMRNVSIENEISSPAISTPVNSHNIYETPKGTMLEQTDNLDTRETKFSEDNSEIPIDVSCSKPKIRKIEAVNLPLGQRLKETDNLRTYQPDISYSPKHYVPSVMSSNLSNAFETALQEMPCGESDNQAISAFPSLSNWKNWSPPNSVRSLASSISKIGQSKETNEVTNADNEQNQSTQFDFGSFFSMKPSQNPRHIF